MVFNLTYTLYYAAPTRLVVYDILPDTNIKKLVRLPVGVWADCLQIPFFIMKNPSRCVLPLRPKDRSM